MTLLVLIGPKGSGKTHIGAVSEERLEVHFIRVEPILAAWSDYGAAFIEVERQISRALTKAPVVAIESTGIVPAQISALCRGYPPARLVRVHASTQTCYRRFRARDPSVHIPVSPEAFREINHRAAQVRYDWDCVLDNDAGLTDDEIAEAIGRIL